MPSLLDCFEQKRKLLEQIRELETELLQERTVTYALGEYLAGRITLDNLAGHVTPTIAAEAKEKSDE